MARFVYDLQMRWGDMDAYKHVNNVVYLRYIEQARVAMFYDVAKGASTFDQGIVIANHEIQYLRPVVYHPEPLHFELWISKVGGASFAVSCEVFDNGKLAARGKTSCVRYDFANERPMRLTDAERALLAGFADGPAS